MIYLDNAATTYPKPESVYKALDDANRNLAFNSGRGSYKVARKATELIESTRKKMLKLVNMDVGEVVFASSITIAINQILNGLDFQSGDCVYVSPYEHNAVARTLYDIEKRKSIQICEMPIKDDTLEIDLDKLKYMFSKQKPKCVCCNHISNVTGYILPVEEVFELSKQYGAITVLDTAQSLGLVEVNSKNILADFIAFAGHKSLYGPFGIGGFITSGKVPLNVYFVGGTGSNSLDLNMPNSYPFKYEASSTNIVAIAGLNAALDELNVDEIYLHEEELVRYLVNELKKIPEVIVYEPPEDRHIGIVSFNIKGYKAEDVGMILDEDYDIAVRTGYHCAPYIHRYLKNTEYLGTVRVGVGRYSTNSDMDVIVNAISDIL